MKAAIAIAIAMFLAGVLPACTSSPEAEDGAGDDLVEGKADSAFSDAELAGAVRAANELSFDELDDAVPLSARTAKNIVAARPLADATALDAVPYVGPRAFAALVAYAHAQGWVDVLPALRRVGTTLGRAKIATTEKYMASVNTSFTQVHVDVRSVVGWQSEAVLNPPSGVTMFGQELSLDGTTLAVTGNAGSASMPNYHTYVFAHGDAGWTSVQALDGGIDVAVGGDFLAISDTNLTLGGGAVTIYERVNSSYQPRGVVSGPSWTFGQTLAIGDGLLAIGSSDGVYVLDLDAGVFASSALQYVSSTHVTSLAVDRGIIVVGSNREPQGAATFITADAKGTWQTTSVVSASGTYTASRPSFFGLHVALFGDNVVVSAPFAGTSYEGGIFVYDRAGALLASKTGEANRTLGVGLAASGGTLVVSANDALYSN